MDITCAKECASSCFVLPFGCIANYKFWHFYVKFCLNVRYTSFACNYFDSERQNFGWHDCRNDGNNYRNGERESRSANIGHWSDWNAFQTHWNDYRNDNYCRQNHNVSIRSNWENNRNLMIFGRFFWGSETSWMGFRRCVLRYEKYLLIG